MISLVINTCALSDQVRYRSVLSSGKQLHEQRAFALRNFILPAALADPTFDEVIVAGEWEPGDGYTYIEVPSEHFSCVDALAQRQAGFEKSRGDWVVFQHDDHMLENGYSGHQEFWGEDILQVEWLTEKGTVDVLVPARYTRLRNVNGERLPNGECTKHEKLGCFRCFDETECKSYVSGHCAIYRCEVLEACPWGDVPKQFTWDMEHTAQIRTAGFNIEWTDSLRVWDCESGATPWL